MGIELKLKDVMYIIKAATFLSNATFINFFLLIRSIFLVIGKALAVI